MKRHTQTFIHSLEKRYLFDAAGAAVVGDILTNNLDIEASSFFENDSVDLREDNLEDQWIDSFSVEKNAQELIIIDQAVDDWQQVERYFGGQATILVLEQNGDAFGQITTFIAENNLNNIESLHIVSHGHSGVLELAGERIDQQTLVDHAKTLGDLGEFLSDTADLHFYGCNVAEGEKGFEFVQSLAVLTGADVAASDDLTGYAEAGGDWTLETYIGVINTNSIEVANFTSVLMATPDIQNFDPAQTLNENDLNTTPQLIDTDVTLTTTNPDLDGGRLVLASDGGSDDQLGIRNQGTGVGEIGVSGTDVTYEGVIIGTIVQDGLNGNDLEITFNAQSTTQGVEALIENLTYQTTSDAPNASVDITVFVNDGTGTTTYDAVVLADNPVAYYRLNETGGTTANNLGTGGSLDSTYTNGVTLNAPPLYNGGPPSAQFDGIDDHVAVPDSSLINTSSVNARTVELLFNADTVAGRQVLFEEGGGTNALSLYIDNGNLYVQVRDSGEFGPFNIMTAVSTGTTYHAALVFDPFGAGMFTGYLNGVSFGSAAVTTDLDSHGGDIAIGSQRNANFFHDGADGAAFDHFFQGRIGEVAIYNSALSQADLQARVDATLGSGISVTQTITITPQDDAPVLGSLGTLDVIENTANGTVVTTIVGTDPDAVDTISYSLVGGNVDGIFAIDPVTGDLRVDDNTNLDFETGLTQYDLIIRATENGGGALFTEETLTVNISDAGGDPNVPPQVIVNNGLGLDQGETVTIQTTDLSASDPGGVSVDWFNTNWEFRQAIRVNAAQVTNDVTDYALLIDGSGFGADFWNNVQTDGSDIVVALGDGLTVLDRELVTIDVPTQTLQLYVRLPTLSSTIDTDLFVYYGNSGASETNDTTVWQSGFVGVWHFEDDIGSSTVINDSSGAGNDGAARQGLDGNNIVTGQVGNAFDFNNSEYIALNYSYNGVNAVPAVSVTAWINTTHSSGSISDNWAILDFDRSDFFNVYIHGNGQLAFSTQGSGGINDFTATGPAVNDGQWHHVAAVYDGTDKILYVDGVEVSRVTNPHSGDALGSSQTRFGFIGDGSEATSFDGTRNNTFYDGQFDNIRFFEGTLDAGWINAEFNNTDDPSLFVSVVGGQETFIRPITYTITDAPNAGTIFNNGVPVGVSGTFTQADLEANLITYQHNDSRTSVDSFSFVLDDTLDTSSPFTFTFDIAVEDTEQINQDILEETFVSGETSTEKIQNSEQADDGNRQNNQQRDGIILSTIRELSDSFNSFGEIERIGFFSDQSNISEEGQDLQSNSEDPFYQSNNIVYSIMRDLDIYTLETLFGEQDDPTETITNEEIELPSLDAPSTGFLYQLQRFNQEDRIF